MAYIEREALFVEIEKMAIVPEDLYDYGILAGVNAVREALGRIPDADVAPVVHGRWDDYHFVKVDCPKSGFPTVKCSNCEIAFCDLINNHHFMYHYCPNCGARMDGE